MEKSQPSKYSPGINKSACQSLGEDFWQNLWADREGSWQSFLSQKFCSLGPSLKRPYPMDPLASPWLSQAHTIGHQAADLKAWTGLRELWNLHVPKNLVPTYLLRSQTQGWASQLRLILRFLPRQAGGFLYLLELLCKLQIGTAGLRIIACHLDGGTSISHEDPS